MRDKDAEMKWLSLALYVALLLVAALFGVDAGRDGVRKQAIAHGAAHYVVNPQTGEKEFEWVNKAEGE